MENTISAFLYLAIFIFFIIYTRILDNRIKNLREEIILINADYTSKISVIHQKISRLTKQLNNYTIPAEKLDEAINIVLHNENRLKMLYEYLKVQEETIEIKVPETRIKKVLKKISNKR